MIFQDPYSSLNPRKTVGSIIGEPFVIHGVEPDEGARKKRVQELMDTVGLNPEHYNRLPARVLRRPAPAHRRRARDRAEAEADRRRRAGLGAGRLDPGADPQPAARPAARARADDRLHRPRPVGRAPHVRPHRGHVPRQDRRAGDAPSSSTQHPRHPYTGALLSAVPVPDPRLAREKQRQILGGDVPSPTNPPPACRFHTRCPKVVAGTCDVDEPLLERQGGRQPRRLPLPADDRRDHRARADGCCVGRYAPRRALALSFLGRAVISYRRRERPAAG